MNMLYEVQTCHTKKMMKAFAKMYTEMKGAKMVFRFAILAAIFFTLPRAMNAPKEGYIVCYSFGVFTVLLAFLRPYLTYLCLLLQNKMYKEAVPITMSFGHSGFEVIDLSKNTYKYSLIMKLYADAVYLYLHMENGDLFIIPKQDFVSGTAEEFYEFIQKTTGKVFEGVNLNFKQRLIKMKNEMHRAEVEHDKKLKKKKK